MLKSIVLAFLLLWTLTEAINTDKKSRNYYKKNIYHRGIHTTYFYDDPKNEYIFNNVTFHELKGKNFYTLSNVTF